MKGEIAQGDKKIDEQSVKTRLYEDGDLANFRLKIALEKVD